MAEQATEILTVEQAAEYLKISRRHIYDMIANGLIPHFHLGRATRIVKSDLDEKVVHAHKHRTTLQSITAIRTSGRRE